MKIFQIASLALIYIGFSPGIAAEALQPVEKPAPLTTARIVGHIPDGTQPPPEPPKPKFIVPPQNILETKIHEQGGRQITIRKIAPIALPLPQKPAQPLDLKDPSVQERIAKFRATNRNYKMLLVGATVYRLKDSPPRSLVHIWPQAEGEPITVWSSADFALLSGFPTFADSADSTTRLMLMWSVSNLDTRTAFQAKFARQFKAPEIPKFPVGKATFVISSGNPTPQTLASIQSLHDLYNNEHARLAAAYEGRQRAQLQHEAYLKANPPQPKDITLDYWRIERPVPAKGGAK